MNKPATKREITTTTEELAERIYEALRTSPHRLTADDLARVAGCSKRKVYLLIGLLKGLMESDGNITISNKRSVGYRIAGHSGTNAGDIDDEQKQIDILMELTKSAERGFSHFRRHAKLLPMIDRTLLRDPDQIELLSINIGMQIATAVVFQYQDRLKAVASQLTKQRLLEAKEETEAPSSAFGLKTFGEMLRSARDDDNYDGDE